MPRTRLKGNRWLEKKHPVWQNSVELWEMNERRLFGGHEVLEELQPFDWEDKNGDHYKLRQQQAIYTNFGDRFATVMVGHLMRHAPGPEGSLSFGTLGPVRRLRDLSNPGPAEMFYYNTDGVGGDGSKWDNYWTYVSKWAVAAGHRWVLVEGPPTAPRNRRDERNGMRPFLADYSPIDVTNWHFVNGQLTFAVIKRPIRKLTIVDDEMEGNDGEFEYLATVAAGSDIGGPLGELSATGGWIIYDDEGTEVKRGTYEQTAGEIPLIPLYYERVRPNDRRVMMSRPGTTEMGQASVAHMNLDSAATFDAWDSAMSVQALIDVDTESANLFVSKMKEGTRYPPLVRARDSTSPPDIKDASHSAVTSDIFDKRIKAIEDTAEQLMWNELKSAPYASGESRKILFTDTRAPRLAVFASEIETTQNAVIRWTEMMWKAGVKATGATEWTKKFDLLDPMNAARTYFEIQALSGLQSPELDAKVMAMVARSNGFLGDTAEFQKAIDEFKESAGKLQEEKQANIDGIKAGAAARTNRTQAQNGAKGVKSGATGGSGGRKTGVNSR